jgi:protein gp37
MEGDWVRFIRDQCQTQNVAFFFKQWGGVQKHRYGRELDDRIYDEYPNQTLAYVGFDF